MMLPEVKWKRMNGPNTGRKMFTHCLEDGAPDHTACVTQGGCAEHLHGFLGKEECP